MYRAGWIFYGTNYCKNKIVLIDKRLETAQERMGRIRRGEYEKTERIGSCNIDDKSLLQKETWLQR